jgi:hypothetical protein
MAGTITADFIRSDANRLSLQVGNTTFATTPFPKMIIIIVPINSEKNGFIK